MARSWSRVLFMGLVSGGVGLACGSAKNNARSDLDGSAGGGDDASVLADASSGRDSPGTGDVQGPPPPVDAGPHRRSAAAEPLHRGRPVRLQADRREDRRASATRRPASTTPRTSPPGPAMPLVDAHTGQKVFEAAPAVVERRRDRHVVRRPGVVVRLLDRHDARGVLRARRERRPSARRSSPSPARLRAAS